MNYVITHELPKRLRLSLIMPKRIILDTIQIETPLTTLNGVKKVSFNHKTLNLLILYNGSHSVKATLLKAIHDIPLTIGRKQAQKPTTLSKKRAAVIISGSLLALRPLIPLQVRPFITFYGAIPIFKKAIRELFNKRLNVDVLDSTAIASAMLTKEYLTASVISFLLKVSEYFEEWTRHRARTNLRGVFDFHGRRSWVHRNGIEEEIDTKDIKIGDIVVVRAGAHIPIDGIIIKGEAMINQASLTGEPLSVIKRTGVTVYAGTVVEQGWILIKTTKTIDETRISKMIALIEDSERLKADVQSYSERLADRIVPYTFFFSGIVYLFTGNSIKAASVLIVDYSCAIKLSTPLTIRSALTDALKQGAFIKGGKFIEKLAIANTFIFDKTGTLTEARPKVVDVRAFNGYSRDYILRNAACVEEHFPHPVASAVVKKAQEEGLIHHENHSEVEYIIAHGIASKIDGKRILVGSRHFIHEDNQISVEGAEHIIKDSAQSGHSILYITIGDELAGVITVNDPVRAESYNFLQYLKDDNTVERIIMLTGDHRVSAKYVAHKLGINEYYSQMSPEDKLDIIQGLQNQGHTVIMVGDGINDSPALSLADVGVSMKQGADIAKETCNVVLLDGNLEKILISRTIARNAMLRIKQHFRYIIGTNTFLICFGLIGVLPPVFSALIHNSTTVAVAVNSLQPLKIKKKRKDKKNSGDKPFIPKQIRFTNHY